jgi:hypothetical protein
MVQNNPKLYTPTQEKAPRVGVRYFKVSYLFFKEWFDGFGICSFNVWRGTGAIQQRSS